MYFFIGVGAIVLGSIVLMLTIEHNYHKKNMKKVCKELKLNYGYADFETFKQQFNRVKWEYHVWHLFRVSTVKISEDYIDIYRYMITNKDKLQEISAASDDLIFIDGTGMIMKSSWAYYRARSYLRRYISNCEKKQKLLEDEQFKKNEITWKNYKR